MTPCEERARFQTEWNVPRETMEALDHYVDLLRKWTGRINLVAPSTLDHIWMRHIADSAQLLAHIDQDDRSLVDLGSGAGLPGIVMAIIYRGLATTTLVESDARKCAFLRQCSSELHLDVRLKNDRIEALPSLAATTITARALAPITELIPMIVQHRLPEGRALLLKGASANNELDAARAVWNFEYRIHRSRTHPEAAVIEIGAVHGRR